MAEREARVAERALERDARRVPGLFDVDERGPAIDRADARHPLHVGITSVPAPGRTAPQTPLPAPNGTSATPSRLAQRTIAATSSVHVGQTIASGRWSAGWPPRTDR